ncbi:hypothetical protein GmarT_38700 [Gimesia maris]|uniref:Uncharacterized protein n=1 Tax=Gimesia maris TaxID=122 RepID=A0ABX5YQY3_9PLAN|nr:hypothetical protein CA11_37860 [Gimesia maris]QEG17985.1 hypothetical protein GmarT_38700 [Gimesia maris]
MQVIKSDDGATIFAARFVKSRNLCTISVNDPLTQDCLKQLADFMVTHIHNREGASGRTG